MFVSACRRAEDGEVAVAGERLQPPAHAPESHAVHATGWTPRRGTHRHPVTRQPAAPPAGTGTGARRAGLEGQPEHVKHGGSREVSVIAANILWHLNL